jgi:hypothetical protein
MIGIATKHATKLIASAISFVPSAAGRTVLRCLPRVFPFQPNPFHLAAPFEQINGIGILPMRQPSVHYARKRSALAVFDPLEVFDDNCLDLREVNLFDLSRQFFPDLSARVFFSFIETLNLGVKFSAFLLRFIRPLAKLWSPLWLSFYHGIVRTTAPRKMRRLGWKLFRLAF